MNKIPKAYRQGDVLVIEVDKIPSDAKKITNNDGKVTLAFGEVTGHHHSFEIANNQRPNVIGYSTTRKAQRTNVREIATPTRGELASYIEVTEESRLTHQEHTAHVIPPGTYKVIRQVEYTPQGLRNVMD